MQLRNFFKNTGALIAGGALAPKAFGSTQQPTGSAGGGRLVFPMNRNWRMKVARPFSCLVLALVAVLPLCAQMLDPAIDRPDEPFSYFSKPTDVIGVMDAPAATMITPEGYLCTGFGELMFFTGNPLVPVNQRVKTLMNGWLPVIHYAFEDRGVSYHVTAFSATLDGKPESPMMNFIRVTITNSGNTPATRWFGLAVRYQNEVNTDTGVGDNRFRRPAKPSHPGDYYQPGVTFNPDWEYGFTDDGLLRDGKLMYLAPAGFFQRMLVMKEPYNGPPNNKTRKLHVLPTTPVGITEYKISLAAGGEATLDLKMPYEPLPPQDDELKQLRAASYEDYLARTVAFWEKILARGIDISVPEDKVNETFKANLVYDLIARDKAGDNYIQTVNKFHYHEFWLRDSSFIARMYDISGYHDFARQVLDFFPRWQQPDGNFVSQGGQFDGWGQTLWAYGQHYRITHDRDFAERVYPSVEKAVAWLHQARQNDPLRLMPATSPGDNENLTGHVTGHNFWALVGLKNAIAIAHGLGRKQDGDAWQKEYDDYRSTFVQVLDRVTSSTGGFIPPGLDGEHGQDWGNMLAVYPELILDPFDPKVTATLQGTRAKYQEGIMTYGDGRYLHHYLTMKNTETEIIRGDQKLAIDELYALLLHTSSTHAGFEFAILPWGTRDPGFNLTPHGWFAAKFRTMFRNMMVREQGPDLHLLSLISPEWIKEGKRIAVNRAATYFGQVNFSLEFPIAGQALLMLDNHFTDSPANLVLHLPWFMDVTRLSADGKLMTANNGAVVVPSSTRKVEIQWTKRADVEPYSYARAVDDYRAEYRRRYERFLETGDR